MALDSPKFQNSEPEIRTLDVSGGRIKNSVKEYKHHELLERECNDLDKDFAKQIVRQGVDPSPGLPEFSKYVEKL